MKTPQIFFVDIPDSLIYVIDKKIVLFLKLRDANIQGTRNFRQATRMIADDNDTWSLSQSFSTASEAFDLVSDERQDRALRNPEFGHASCGI